MKEKLKLTRLIFFYDVFLAVSSIVTFAPYCSIRKSNNQIYPYTLAPSSRRVATARTPLSSSRSHIASFFGIARKMGNNLKQNDSYDNYSYDSFVLKIRVFGGYDL